MGMSSPQVRPLFTPTYTPSSVGSYPQTLQMGSPTSSPAFALSPPPGYRNPYPMSIPAQPAPMPLGGTQFIPTNSIYPPVTSYQPVVPIGHPSAIINTVPEIAQALQLLSGIQHLPGDEQYLRNMGIDVIFRGGADAARLIQEKNVNVVFGDMGDSPAHAQWLSEDNTIMVNQKYQGDMRPENLYAISEAIYHEAGHAARSGDNQASIQEELNCLALNVLGYRYHTAVDPQFAQSASQSRLIQDGVALYARLFFDADPTKQALVNRVIEKYGMLPTQTPDHQIPLVPMGQVNMLDRICRQLHNTNTSTWSAMA